ncbi:MAG TPA: PIG-L deacetylase family protein [Chloroflexota bacterium]|nr:PIG-L deacetylase family protein [Chloroflexota bacterium]
MTEPSDVRAVASEEQRAAEAEEIPSRILVVAAHPDDAEFGCGGTVAKWVRQGSTAFYLICTNGDKGSDEFGVDPEELAARREREQRAAAAVIGVSEVAFLPRRDGELVYGIDLRGDVVRWIRTWKPDAVFTHDPSTIITSTGYVNHADHRAAGQAAVDAVYPFSRSPLQYPEQIAAGLQPHSVPQLYLWGANDPNYFVDVSDSVSCKVDALRHHESQFGDFDRVAEFAKERLRKAGEDHGVEYAETFRRVLFRR